MYGIHYKKTTLREWFDYFLIYLLLATNLVVAISIQKSIIYSLFIVFFFLFHKRKITYDREFLVIFFSLLLVMIFQVVIHQFLPLYNYMGFAAKIIFGFLVLKYVGSDFIIKYVKVLYVLTLIGLLLWIGVNLSSSFKNILNNISYIIDYSSDKQTLYVFNLEDAQAYNLYRNDGFAYEPGAYSIALLFALYFNYLLKGNFFNYKTIVFVLALLSTFSTAGYAVLFVILIGMLYNRFKKRPLILVISVLFISYIGYYAYSSLDFMKDKIENQLSLIEDKSETRGRFASALNEIKLAKGNLVFGIGFVDETRFSDSYVSSDEKGSVNGIFYLISGFGIVFFFIYLIYLYRSFVLLCAFFKRNKITVISFFISVLIVAFTQTCLTWALLFSIIFLPTVYRFPKVIL